MLICSMGVSVDGFINDREAVHIASVHRYDEAQKTFVTVSSSLLTRR